jgi:hypothetical protein
MAAGWAIADAIEILKAIHGEYPFQVPRVFQ